MDNERNDWRLSPDTIYWSIVAMLLCAIVGAYRLGAIHQEHLDRIEWLEDQALGKNIPETKGVVDEGKQ